MRQVYMYRKFVINRLPDAAWLRHTDKFKLLDIDKCQIERFSILNSIQLRDSQIARFWEMNGWTTKLPHKMVSSWPQKVILANDVNVILSITVRSATTATTVFPATWAISLITLHNPGASNSLLYCYSAISKFTDWLSEQLCKVLLREREENAGLFCFLREICMQTFYCNLFIANVQCISKWNTAMWILL